MRRVIFVISLFLAACLGAAVSAQETSIASQSDSVVARAKEAINSEAASVDALGVLRNDMDSVRKDLSEVVSAGSVDARTIEADIDALGPPPGENKTEPDEIAARRTELRNELAKANRPIREAQERLNEIELLIHELDKQIRRKDANKLLRRIPSILLPTTIATAAEELKRLSSEAGRDVARSFANGPFSENRIGLAGLASLLAGVGLALIFGVRPILGRLFDHRFEQSHGPRRYLWAFLSNISSLLIPLVGAVSLALVVPLFGIEARIVDFAGQFVLSLLVVMVVANWLGHTVFSPNAPSRRLVSMDDGKAQQGLRLCQALGVIGAAELFAEALADGLISEKATISIIAVPILVVAALLLWRLASLLDHSLEEAGQTGEKGDALSEQGEANRGLVRLLIYMLRAIALVSVPLSVVGYVNLSRYLSDAMVMTAGLVGLGLFFYALITGSIRAFVNRGQREEATLPLLPFVIGSLLALAMLPAFALVWGARTSDVLEAWRLVTVGVEIGDVRLSLGVVVSLLIVFFLGSVLTRWVQRGLREAVLPKTRLDPGARNALVTGVGYVGLTLAALIAFSAAGLSLSSLAFVAGALSLGIGFGMQTIVSNFVSGIILLIERPISEGDWIEVSGYSGIVKKIAVRSTQISTFDKHDVIVPNQDLIGGAVKNMTLSSRHGRLIIPVGIAYGSDLEAAKKILEQAAADNTSLLAYPAPVVLFRGLGDSSLDFELRCYLKDVDTMLSTQSDLLFRIYVDLSKAGIEIPFPQRDVNLRQIPAAAEPELEQPDRAETSDRLADPA